MSNSNWRMFSAWEGVRREKGPGVLERRLSFHSLVTDLVPRVASDGSFSGVCCYWPDVPKGRHRSLEPWLIASTPKGEQFTH